VNADSGKAAFAARLTAAAQDALQRPGHRLGPLRPLPGGRSGVTLAGELVGPDGARSAVVVKAAPEGRAAVGRHDVLRQARILDALAPAAAVVVPRVLARAGGDLSFYVMERCAGEAVEPVLDAATRVLPADLVRTRALVAARMLAALHATPVDEPVSDLADEVDRWAATAAAVEPGLAPGATELAAALRAHQPATDAPAVLVHGDFRLGNIVFDGPVATGLIDWEIWGRTQAGVDLGWFLVFCDADAFPGIGRPVDGLPSAGELLAEYERAGGRPVEQLAWYEAFGRFKMAAIMAHNLQRHRQGRHVDPFQERLPATIARLLETGAERLAGVG
jgi:aminoglycoside phosphotransferase (APT) family kinase protein